MDLKETVKRYILSQDLIRKGDRIIAGISGGADSVCLFLLLLELKDEIGFSLSVIHIEHGIRGDASREDASFVEDLCKQNQIPCTVKHLDVPHFAESEGISVEEAARILRYREFYQLQQQERKAQEDMQCRIRIAVAHNREDQAETMLFHLIRGSSVRGLGGMRPIQNDLIRPLLEISRGEIMQYLTKKGQLYRNDETNEDPSYSRNRIRKDVMPVLRKINTGAAFHMATAAAELAEVQDYLDAETYKAKREMVTEGEQPIIRKEGFSELPLLIQRGVIYEALAEVCGSRKDITRAHVEEIRTLMENQSGRQISLPYNVNAQRIYQGIRLVRLHTGESKDTTGKTKEELQKLIVTRVLDMPEELSIPKKQYTKWFDYDKIKYRPLVRTRLSGDFLMTGVGEKKLLKKFFIDEKIPGEERQSIPLLCDGSHVVWVIGYRISEYYKITEQTKRILEVTYIGGLKE